MFRFEPFKSGHLQYLIPQPEQRHEHQALMAPSYAVLLEENIALSAWNGSVCVAAAGCIRIFNHRAVGWALLSREAAPFMLPIVRKVREVIAASPYQRVEIAVQHDFIDGHRFAKLLGMQLETPEPMKAHGATGQDEMMYAVVK